MIGIMSLAGVLLLMNGLFLTAIGTLLTTGGEAEKSQRVCFVKRTDEVLCRERSHLENDQGNISPDGAVGTQVTHSLALAVGTQVTQLHFTQSQTTGK